MHDLITATACATPGGRASAEEHSIATARLSAVMADIQDRLCDDDLSVGDVAQRQRVSLRCVQRLFAATGLTFSSFVREQRLAYAYRLLNDPHAADCTIGAIALDVGFSDLSYFCRAFRKRYGVAPREVRNAAVIDHLLRR